MKPRGLWRKNISCALDLGHGWAKTVCLAGNRKKVSLHRLGRMPWKPGELKQPEHAGSRLRELWSSLHLQEQTMVSSMAGHSVIIKQLELQLNQAKNMQQAVLAQAQEHIPFDLQDVYLDFELMGPGQHEGTQKVILVASKKKMVQDLQKIFAKAGLGAIILDADGFALSNCFEYNYPEYKQEVSYLLDIGSGHSIFCVYAQARPVLVRDMDIGAQQLTEKLATALDQSLSAAEKMQFSAPGDLRGEEQHILSKEKERLFLSWSTEIQRFIHFYQGSVQDRIQAKRLFLAGGGSLIPGLKASLARSLDLQVQHLNPWRALTWDSSSFDQTYLQSIAPQFTVAVGLALRRMV